MNDARTISRRTAVTALGLLALGTTTAPAHATPPRFAWKEVSSGVRDGILYDIDSRAGATWTVGLTETPGEHGEGDWHPLALHLEGDRWVETDQPFDDGHLLAVSVVDGCDVWAVGEKNPLLPQPILQHWNGEAWQVVQSPPLPPGGYGEFTAVAATRGHGVWVAGWIFDGTRDRIVVYRYAKDRWHPFELAGIAYPYDLVRVGGGDVWLAGGSVVWHYDGRRWERAELPADTVGRVTVMGLAAPGTRDVWAVGLRDDPRLNRRPLVLHYDGRRWTEIPSPAHTAELNAVSLVAGVPVAFGNHPVSWEPYTLQHDGNAFVRVEDPPGAGNQAASVTIGDQIWVVGGTEVPGELHHPSIAVGSVVVPGP